MVCYQVKWLISFTLIKFKCNPNKSAGQHQTQSDQEGDCFYAIWLISAFLRQDDWSLCFWSNSNVIQINQQANARQGPHLTWKKLLSTASGMGNQTSKRNLHFTFDGCSNWIRIGTWDQIMSQTQNTGTFWFIGQIWRSRGGTDTDIPWRLKSAKGGSDWGCKFLGTPKLDLTLYGCIKRSNMG